MNINQEVEMLRREITNGPPLFPPPNDNAVELSEHFKRRINTRLKKLINSRMLLCHFIINQTQRKYRKYVIDKVAGELWNTTSRHNRATFQTLCHQINSIIN
jgi:hypothetical protein